MPQVWAALSDELKKRAGRATRDFFENPVLMRQLKEFSEGNINPETKRAEPLRKWKELSSYLILFFEFNLLSSAWMEGRFSVASNAARTKPNCKTQTLSRVVRDHSNRKATEYPTTIYYTEMDANWEEGCDAGCHLFSDMI